MNAAEALRRLLENLERQGRTVMDVVRGDRALEPSTLYPGPYGIFDRWTRSQFYYHMHADNAHEAGHFHTLRLFPDRAVHLVGISMAANGWPQFLFTLNLWAAGDAPDTSSPRMIWPSTASWASCFPRAGHAVIGIPLPW